MMEKEPLLTGKSRPSPLRVERKRDVAVRWGWGPSAIKKKLKNAK
jgi:hypothetical protein